jgi:dihydrofolate reductase
MRKLKLQINISLDGVVSLQDTQFLWNDELREFSIENMKDIDTILLGGHTALGLVPYWAGIADTPADADYELGKRITETPKIVFSHSISKSPGPNTSIVEGPLHQKIEEYKGMSGKDMLMYGSAKLVSLLAKENLIDEYDLLVNPIAAGKGTGIFQDLSGTLYLELIESRQFACGVTLLRYRAGGQKSEERLLTPVAN